MTNPEGVTLGKQRIMPDTFSQIYIQYVFAVKGRDNLIKPSLRMNYINILPELWKVKIKSHWL